MSTAGNSVVKKLGTLITDVTTDPQRGDTAARLDALGFRVTDNLVESFHAICARVGEGSPALAALLVDLLSAPYPAGALVNFLRYLDIAGYSAAFLGNAPIRELLARLFGSSQYMADIVIRNPGYLYWLIEKQTWDAEDSVEAYETQLRTDIEMFQSPETRLDAARRFHRRMLLRIGIKDLLGEQSLEKTTSHLSYLADAVVRTILDIEWRRLAAPEPPLSGFAVLALGKLGGRELNYSSDIDLIYLCDDVDHDQLDLYYKLSRSLTTTLTDATQEGYLYRVDLRLRPDGPAGPVVNTLSSMRVYYENRGRPWEFQAMLKARVIAGDRAIGEKFLSHIAGLIFSPSLSYSPVDSIALMRTRIHDNISDNDRTFNIKLMEGGIRDIEFVVQMLQLTHGGQHRDIRGPNTIAGVHAARKLDLLTRTEHDSLVAAYRFFRLVEHRLQMMHQFKTHSIPSSPHEIDLLARRVSNGPLGFFDYDAFLDTLGEHISFVRQISDTFFSGGGETHDVARVLFPDGAETSNTTLAAYGIADPEQALRILRSLAYGSFPELMDRGTRAAFQSLLPDLLEALSTTPDPGGTLVNFSKIATTARRRSAFYGFLKESPPAMGLVRDICGSATVLATRLSRNPDELGAILEDPERFVNAEDDSIGWRALVAEHSAANALNTRAVLEKRLDRALLAAWVIDMTNETFPTTMAATITATTRRWIASVFDALIERADGVALFAMGSFAIGEPRPASDVDLLIVTHDRNIEDVTRSIQALGRFFDDTHLLKIDFRLRGEGASAPLVQDLGLYRGYVDKRMSPWEHVAFAKCARWAGDTSLADEFRAVVSPCLTRRFSGETIAALKRTRIKLEALVPSGGDLLETKRSAGARYDIEYMCSVGTAQLQEPFDPEVDSEQRVRTLRRGGLIAPEQALMLLDALSLFARVDYLLALQDRALPSTPQKIQRAVYSLDKTFDLLGFTQKDGIETSLRRAKQQVRACYEQVLDIGV